MIGLDTNILVRYLAQDGLGQAKTANHVMEQRLTAEEPGFVSLVTITETAWVLRRTYGMSRTQVALVIERILQINHLEVQNEKQVFAAAAALKAGIADFEDALIGAVGAWAGCRKTLTFDKKASRIEGFELL